MWDRSSQQVLGRIDPAAAISLMLHVTAVFALALLPARKLLQPPPEQGIAVEIVAWPQAAISPTTPPVIEEKAAPPTPDSKPIPSAAPLPGTDGTIHPKELFSSRVLADARSKGTRTTLRQLSRDDRMIQLCNVEVMEQVHRWNSAYQPDFVVAYAMADTKVSALTVRADGGALRSKRHWYNVRFECRVAPDLEKVVAFEFSLGEEIPRSEWEAHFLPVADGAPD